MIFYSNVNEDNYAEKHVMDKDSYQNLIAVSGSGERVISLMAHPNLKNIHVIDLNKEALYLMELKLIAIFNLEIPEYLEFIGYLYDRKTAPDFYKKICGHLSGPCKNFWDNHPRYIEKGILNIGHFESFLNKIRPAIRLTLGKEFFKLFDQDELSLSYISQMRWKCIKSIFTQRWIYYLFGLRDNAFLAKEADLSIIPKALQKSINDKLISESSLAHLIFFGNFKKMNQRYLPPSLNREFLINVKNMMKQKNIEIQYHHVDCLETIKSITPMTKGKSFYSLSDILSFEDFDYLLELTDYVKRKSPQDGFTIIARSFAKNRFVKESLTELEKMKLLVKNISELDKTNMYQLLQLEKL